jgi:HNH endonuclease
MNTSRTQRSEKPGTFFESSRELSTAFPSGSFNCWGLMGRAEARFQEMSVGDLVLIAPWIGVHGGGIHQLGVVKVKCPVRCYEASQVLWPNIEDPNKLYPFLFFFDTEIGLRSWFQFLDDLGYDEKFNPRGYYLRLDASRFDRWGGVEGYVQFLRSQCGFKRLSNDAHPQLLKDIRNDRELEQARVKEEEEGAFSSSDLEDARRRILAAIVLRQGQRGFREQLLAAYQRACAVTSCDVIEALEAAHIIAYLGPETNYVTNGLLLRADIHTLFDLGLIVVQPNDYRVIVSKRLRGTSYESLAGQVIRLPADLVDHPSRQALEQRMVEFQSKESCRSGA